MKIILQNSKSLHYIHTMQGWTKQHDQARVFPHGIDALFFCYNSGMPDMVMLFEFTDPRMNFSMAVTDSKGD